MSPTLRSRFTGYLAQPDGPEVYVMDGDEYPADHPLVTTHPQYFEDAATYDAHERVDITTYADLPGQVTMPGRPRRRRGQE